MAEPCHLVSVSREARRKIAKVADELLEQGVSVEFDVEVRTKATSIFRVRPVRGRKAKSAFGVQHVNAVWNGVTHAWLVFTILREAIGAWPKIRKLLVGAGLSDDEITVLGLTKLTRKPTRTKKPAKARRRTR